MRTRALKPGTYSRNSSPVRNPGAHDPCTHNSCAETNFAHGSVTYTVQRTRVRKNAQARSMQLPYHPCKPSQLHPVTNETHGQQHARAQDPCVEGLQKLQKGTEFLKNPNWGWTHIYKGIKKPKKKKERRRRRQEEFPGEKEALQKLIYFISVVLI